jgi:hypothetical protein
MQTLAVVVLFVLLQAALRRVVYRPMLRKEIPLTAGAVLIAVPWVALPILAVSVGGAHWSLDTVVIGAVSLFVSVFLFVRYVLPHVVPGLRQ